MKLTRFVSLSSKATGLATVLSRLVLRLITAVPSGSLMLSILKPGVFPESKNEKLSGLAIFNRFSIFNQTALYALWSAAITEANFWCVQGFNWEWARQKQEHRGRELGSKPGRLTMNKYSQAQFELGNSCTTTSDINDFH